MKTKNKVGQRLFAGAEIFKIASKPVDVNHKSKEKELRIEKLALICMPKALVVNEVKLTHGPGGSEIYVVNGGDNKVLFPGNYKFAEDAGKFDLEKEPDTYFPSYKEAISICNAENESEINRLTIIRDDIEEQINCLIAANKANTAAIPLYEEEED